MSDRYEVIDENKLGRLLRGRGGEFEVYVGEDRSAHEIAAELNRLAEERDDAAINVKVYNHNRITLAKELGAIHAENDKLRAERDRLKVEVEEYEQLIELQNSRMNLAADLWRGETGADAMTRPDMGELLEFLMAGWLNAECRAQWEELKAKGTQFIEEKEAKRE